MPNWEISIPLFSTSIKELAPDDPQFYFLRGMVYAQKRLISNAIADFQKVIELSDSEDLDEQAQEWIKLLQSNPQ